jgi:hypothetical protein
MKKLFAGLLLTAGFALTSFSVYAQQSVAGVWMMSVQGMSLRLVMAQDGEKISGTLESPHGEIRLSGDFTKGKLTIVGTSMEQHPIQFAGSATLTAEGSLVGNISADQMVMSFTAVPAERK